MTMNRRKLHVLAIAAVVAVAALVTTTVEARKGRGQGGLGTIYVTSQGLYFDTFVSA